jgi:hypothetical protein
VPLRTNLNSKFEDCCGEKEWVKIYRTAADRKFLLPSLPLYVHIRGF